ncbi:MAG: hypothetical protein QOF55_413 [Thermoleophilaceae bacterium]|nr:hypothetical protein [Thermoleophilaceae bacterium]
MSALVQAGETRSTRIEALRAVAAIGVVVGHVVLTTEGIDPKSLPEQLGYAGGLGVFLFFALTGYLLYWPFARRAFGDGRPISIGGYARNRALRILPLYYVVLAVFLVLNHGGGTFTQWWRFATFSQSFFPDTVATVDGPMWSLVVEVQFYVLLPLLAYGVALVAREKRAVAAGLIAALGVVSAAIWWTKVHQSSSTDLRWRYSLPVTFLGFVPGMLLALLRLELEERPRVRLPSSTMLIVGGVALWVVASRKLDLAEPITAAASFLVLAGVVLPVRPGVLARALDLRVLGLVGVVSYSLYLWHLPIVESLGRHTGAGVVGLLPLALAVCLAVAAASYLVVERPFLRLRSRWGSTVATQAPRGADGS